MLRGKRKQRMVDAVIGEDHERAFGAEALRQDPRRRTTHLAQGVRVGDGGPWRFGIAALGEEDRIGRLPRPLLQPVADAARAVAQRLRRAQHDAAVGAMLGDRLGRCEQT